MFIFLHLSITLLDCTKIFLACSTSSSYGCKKVYQWRKLIFKIFITTLSTSPPYYSYPTLIYTQKNMCLVHRVFLQMPPPPTHTHIAIAVQKKRVVYVWSLKLKTINWKIWISYSFLIRERLKGRYICLQNVVKYVCTLH